MLTAGAWYRVRMPIEEARSEHVASMFGDRPTTLGIERRGRRNEIPNGILRISTADRRFDETPRQFDGDLRGVIVGVEMTQP